MYLIVIIDWFSRYVVGWKLTHGMSAAGVYSCMANALESHGTPSICNSDQGSAFNPHEYEGLLADTGVHQSMDGLTCWVDNQHIKRWFRSLKSECLRQNEYSRPKELRRLVSQCIAQYNGRRPHAPLDCATPFEWYYFGLSQTAYPVKIDSAVHSLI